LTALIPRDGSPPLTRRRFFGGLGVGAAVASGMLGWATCVEPHWLQLHESDLPIAGLPEHLVGKTLVQISDFHLGTTDETHLLATMHAVNELQPDILVLTGDFIDHIFPEATSTIQRVFSLLEPASIATLGCLGNHDYGHRWSNHNLADRVAGTLSDLGIQILRDQHVNAGGLNVFGLEDYWSPNFRTHDVLQDASAAVANVCLCHNPDVCDRPIWGDFGGVILAGHTHGGQCKPPFLPPPRVPVRNRNYVGGFYQVDHRRTLYINRGVGYGLKARFNCRPEITLFRLQQGEELLA
jgi:predicted MPP superfamily phosphohydrolase